MSLRLKALLAVVGLVSLVTGSLGYWVSVQWEAGERERIDHNLDIDLADLKRHHEATRRNIVSHMIPATQQRADLRYFIRGNDPEDNQLNIADNFNPFIKEWLSSTDCDVGWVAFDSFVLEGGRQSSKIVTLDDLVVVDYSDSRQPTGKIPSELLTDNDLALWLNSVFEGFFENSDPRSITVVLGDSVWLIVASPLYNDAGREELSAVAIVMKELSTNWIHSGRSDLRNKMSTVKHVIYSAGSIRASTLANKSRDEACIKKLASAGSDSFKVDFSSDEGNNERWIAKSISLVDGSGVQIVALKSLDAELGRLKELIDLLKMVGIALAIFGVVLAYLLVARVVGRLDVIRHAAASVREGDFEARVSERGRDEVSALSRSFNRMTEGLKALGLYTDPVIAKAILEANDSDIHNGMSVEGTVFFSDIAGFAIISESMTPQELVTQLNDYFSIIGAEIKSHGGYVDKFIGDAVMAWWGPPFHDGENGAESACRAALAVDRGLELFAQLCERDGKPVFRTRIGLAWGPVTVGNLGSESKKNYTVIGDTANLASRLEGVNKVYGTTLLVDESVAGQSKGVIFRELDAVRVKGKTQPTGVFEPVALVGESIPVWVSMYAEALAQYRAGNFSGAQSTLKDVQSADPGSAWLSAQCQSLLESPPGENWEPVTNLETK